MQEERSPKLAVLCYLEAGKKALPHLDLPVQNAPSIPLRLFWPTPSPSPASELGTRVLTFPRLKSLIGRW